MPARSPAVLLNPLSGRVRRRLAAVRSLARGIAGERYAEASESGAMAAAVASFGLEEDDLLCVVAGDGTLHAALTALERLRPGGPWPTIAAAPGGTTNMTARDLDAAGSLLPWLTRLERRAAGGPTTRANGKVVLRPALRIAAAGAPPVVGLFLGAGTVSAGVDFFNRRLRPLGIPEAVGSPAVIVRTLGVLALGGPRLERMAPAMQLELDAGPRLDASALLLAVSTLHRVVVGARPFWGREDGPVHVMLVERTARGIFPGVPRVILGRPAGWMVPAAGWHSRNAGRIRLSFDGPYIVDGELYHARAADGPVEVTATRDVRWWTP